MITIELIQVDFLVEYIQETHLRFRLLFGIELWHSNVIRVCL